MAVTKIDGTRQIVASSITNAVQNFGTPSAATDVAIKSYVDAMQQGLTVKPASRVATIAVLSPANTYANGSSGVGATLTATGVGILTVDGVNTVINDIIYVKNQAAGLQNGLYQVTTEGTAGVAYILTRIVQMDTTLEFMGAYSFVEQGSLATTGWVCSNGTAPTVGTTAITVTQFSGAGTYVQGSGITITGQSIAVDTAVTMTQTNTMSGITNKTFTAPVLGAASATSLATSAATPLIMTNGQAVNVAVTSQTVGATTLTIPDFASVVDEFTFKTKSQTMSNKTFVAPVLGAATGTSLILSSKLDEAKGADIASATPDIGAATGNYVNITGTTAITALGTIQAGTRRIVQFSGILTLTYNATSLILPTSANIITAVGDTAIFVSLGSGNWVCTSYQRRDGTALVASASSTYMRSTVVSGTQDSANKVFTIANTVSSGSEQVYINGQLLMPGASNDYVYNGTTTVTFQAGFTAPASTDVIRVYGNY